VSTDDLAIDVFFVYKDKDGVPNEDCNLSLLLNQKRLFVLLNSDVIHYPKKTGFFTKSDPTYVKIEKKIFDIMKGHSLVLHVREVE